MKLTPEGKQIAKKYGHLFNNTGGNDIVELIERKDVTYDTNLIACELQGCCYSQVCLLLRLKTEGLLK